MKPLRVPGDGAKAAKAHLASVLGGLLGDVEPTVSLGLPDEWTPDSPPHVGVFDDGGPLRWPVYTKPRLRLTVWADGRDRLREVAGMCLGVLLAHRIEGLAVVNDPTPLIENGSRDANGALVASFTVAAIVRTAPVQ